MNKINIFVVFCMRLILIIDNVLSEENIPGNLTDLLLCKVSHFGIEYMGNVGKTESNARCQSWTSDIPHKIDGTIINDDKFPLGSKRESKNFCRNPDENPNGPWCYTMNDDLVDETCQIPLCSYSECRLTGPGMEYGGSWKKGVSDRECLKWNKNRKKVLLVNGNFTQIKKFLPNKFPENSLSKAKTFCRNPDADIGGPWCFVENDETGHTEREYCDIPFCFDPECSTFTKNYSTYMHYTDFNGSRLTDIKFSIKLWNSDQFNNASARLVLSVIALPLTGKEIADLGIGIEIFISNKESALRYGNKDSVEYESTPGILSSTNFTTFTLSWDRGFITLGIEGKTKPIFLAEIKTKGNLVGFYKDHFNYYSMQGTDVIWNFPFCLEDNNNGCDIHTTTGEKFQQFLPLRQKDIGHDLYVYVRAYHSAIILLTPAPTVEYPYFKMTLLAANRSTTRVTIKEFSDGPEIVLKEIQLENIIDYFTWNEFSISFFADSLQLYMKKPTGMHTLLETRHEVFRQLRWFSVSSVNTKAHWSFFCAPPDFAQPPAAILPECAINSNEENYIGTQDITSVGLPCLPWSSHKMIPENEVKTLFTNQSERLIVKNYCRDPKKSGQGTFCYVLNQIPHNNVEKQFCKLRKCKSQICKMAGTGNDFIGRVSVTRSGRECDYWDVSNKSIHPEYMFVYNNSYFADMNSSKAENSCRNPTRDISGSWCFTKDPQMVQEVCNVKDCDRPEEFTIIVSTNKNGRKIFILPQWKEEGIHGGIKFSLKEWNPDLLAGVIFTISSKQDDQEIVLIIGAEMNEKLQLYRNKELIESKTYPHLISAGIWTDFWLQIRKGEIMLGFKGIPTALFEWHEKNLNQAFDPIFLSYNSLYDSMPMGFFFPSNKECHTENTTDNNFLKYIPIGLYSEEENVIHKNLTLKMRGTGQTWISLVWVANSLNAYQIQIDTLNNIIGLHKLEAPPISKSNIPVIKPLLQQKLSHETMMSINNWTTFYLNWSEKVLDIKRNDILVIHYEESFSISVYWFSIAAASGWVTWSANCDPVDLDGPPIDGGWSRWSPWTCTVSCGGGEGFRTRTCSNPHPNIFGKLCDGNPTANGVCNEFPCGDISPDTLEEIQDNLRENGAHSFVIDENTAFTIGNDKVMLKKIEKESPESYFEWTRNGVYITPNERVYLQGTDISIIRAKSEDAGIYVSMVYRPNKNRVILKVLSLAVRVKKFDVDTRATWSYSFQCHSVILGINIFFFTHH